MLRENPELKDKLVAEAKKARENAYVPYSDFAVGAAVLTAEGDVYRGCNVENASLGLTNCAERTALFSAVANGEMEIEAIAVAADTPDPASPCGSCRQVLVEFNPDMEVVMVNTGGEEKITTAAELLPEYFTSDDMA